MKKTLSFVLLMLVSLSSFSQFIVHRVDNPKFIVGSHSGFQLLFGRDALNRKYYDLLVDTEPYAGFFPFKNLCFGVMADYIYTKSTINNYKNRYSVGAFTRYYLPFQMNDETVAKHKLYFEWNINSTNYLIENRYRYPEVYDDFSKIRTDLVVGVNVSLVKEFYIDIALDYMKSIGGLDMLAPRLALEYHFNKSK